MIKTNQKCIHCGISTQNPRFCGRSCAAAHNNKSHPKRKPEGKCSSCGTSINSQKKLCEKCKSAEKEKKFREQQNIHIFQGPHGMFEKNCREFFARAVMFSQVFHIKNLIIKVHVENLLIIYSVF